MLNVINRFTGYRGRVYDIVGDDEASVIAAARRLWNTLDPWLREGSPPASACKADDQFIITVREWSAE